MQIAENTVVTLRYELLDAQGNILEKEGSTLSYLHGGHHGIFPLVEEALHGKGAGDACDVWLEPEDAFGEYDDTLLQVEPRELFPPEVEVGMQFEGAPPGSDEEDFLLYTVTDVAEDKVVVDGNHPLAGQTLQFKCTVENVRKASPEELAHGHVHGEHGHHH